MSKDRPAVVHWHVHVQDEDIYVVLPEHFEGSGSVSGHHDVMAGQLEDLLQRSAHAEIVIGDEDDPCMLDKLVQRSHHVRSTPDPLAGQSCHHTW